jgi:hypothetical protein
MNESEPSRLDKLKAVRTYLRWQVEKIDASIAAEEARLAAPATSWHIEHLPGGDGKRGRGMLHEAGCGFSGGSSLDLDQRGAIMALEDDAVETCSGCKPEAGLRG